MKSNKGFSMIELMVVVAVVGILTAIAIPVYSNYSIRGKIPDATSNLATKRIAMEQYFLDNHNYGTATVTAPPCVADTSSSKYFTFSCTSADSYTLTYTITATGNDPGPMKGFTYTIDQNNTKTSTATSTAPSAWGPSSSQTCWITNTGGAC